MTRPVSVIHGITFKTMQCEIWSWKFQLIIVLVNMLKKPNFVSGLILIGVVLCFGDGGMWRVGLNNYFNLNWWRGWGFVPWLGCGRGRRSVSND